MSWFAVHPIMSSSHIIILRVYFHTKRYKINNDQICIPG